MKYLIILISFILISCSSGSREYERLQLLYPKANISKVPDKNYMFIVCDTNNGVYIIEMYGGIQIPSAKIILKYPTK